jgi:predicted Zn-dependent protease
MARLESLRALVAQDPANSRFRYMLAMDLAAAAQWSEALAELKELIAREPSYLAAYFQAGRAAEQSGDEDGARDLYRRGIAVAAGDAHTKSELQAALDILGG